MVSVSMPLGGKESHIIELSTALSNEGHYVRVLSLDGFWDKNLKRQRFPIGFSFHGFTRINQLLNTLLLNIFTINRRYVIHLHDPVLLRYILLKKRLVCSIHGVDSFHKGAKKYIAVSNLIKNEISSEENCEVLSPLISVNCVDTCRISHNLKRVLVVGRLFDVEKGQLTFLNKIKTIPENVELTFLGDGPDYEAIRNIAKNYSRINISSFLERNDYLKELSAFDIVLSTSKVETFGISVIECICNGLFPVLTHIEVFDEIISRLGYGITYELETGVEAVLSQIQSLKGDFQIPEEFSVLYQSTSQNYIDYYAK